MRKSGKSDKYLRIKKEFEEKFKNASEQYIKKCVSDLKFEQPGKAAATLKRLGARHRDCEEGASFTLLIHIKQNLSVDEQIESFSKNFISVSQEFPPLQLALLSNETRQKLTEIRQDEIMCVLEHEMYEILRRCKKKKSSVPGDMPPRLFYEASAGLAAPAAKIMNKIAQLGSWPRQYLTEYGTPIEKCRMQNAEDESQTRLISCTQLVRFGSQLLGPNTPFQWEMTFQLKSQQPNVPEV